MHQATSTARYASYVYAFICGLTVAGTCSAAEESPGIVPLNSFDTTDRNGKFPPHMTEGDFDGAYAYKHLYASKENPSHRAGIWESEAGVLVIDSYRINEYVELLSGELRTIDADGTEQTFGPGDKFVIPKGWKGRWEMKSHIRKHYVTF